MRPDIIWCDVMQHETTRHDGITTYDTIRYDTIRYDTTKCGSHRRPKMAKGHPRDSEREPKGNLKQAKWSQSHPKGSQRHPNDTQEKPQGSKRDKIYSYKLILLSNPSIPWWSRRVTTIPRCKTFNFELFYLILWIIGVGGTGGAPKLFCIRNTCRQPHKLEPGPRQGQRAINIPAEGKYKW